MYHQLCSWLCCRWAVQCWQGAHSPSCEHVTQPCEELLMLLVLPHEEWGDERPCFHQIFRSSSGGWMLAEWKPHHSIMLPLFWPGLKVAPSRGLISEHWELCASPSQHPPRATILLGTLSLSSPPSAPLDPTEPALSNYSYPQSNEMKGLRGWTGMGKDQWEMLRWHCRSC